MEKSVKLKSKYRLKNTIKSALVIYMLLTTMLITMLCSFTSVFATSVVSTTSDVTPPRGKFEFKDVIASNNINYVNSVNVEVEVKAKDDSDGQIKYYLTSNESLVSTEIPEASWKTYAPGTTDTVVVPSTTELNAIYLVLKDEAGNTSLIYTGTNVEYTVSYNANGGTNFKSAVATKTYYGSPFAVTSQVPKREGYFFKGWSTNQNATAASYKKEDIIPANVFIGGSKTITLYAVWEKMGESNNLLADVVEVGEYVDLPIQYDNVNGSVYNGWRVISKDIDLDGNASEGTVNVVSAGTPLTYYHYNSSSTSKTALTNNFLTTPFSDTENYSYRKNGFSYSKTLTETFTNLYVATKDDGTPKVRAMVAEDIYNATEHTSMQNEHQMGLNTIKYDHLFVNESNYWLASPEDATDLWDVSEDGYIEGYNTNEYGVRPVVSLRKDILTPGKNDFGEWEIRISVPIPNTSGTYTYTTTEQTVTIDKFDQEIMSVTGNKATTVGNYTATVSLKDTSNYYWADGTNASKSFDWTIAQRPINQASIDAIANQTYTRSAITPLPTIKYANKTLVKDTDYTLAYSANTNVGTATITVTGKGNYEGTTTTTFKIVAKSIASATVSAIGEQIWIGSPIEPTPTVKDGSVTLAKGTEYTFSYSNNNAPGTGTVTITGKGNYTGTKNVTFTLIAGQYKVTLDKQSGTGGSGSVTATYTYAMPSATMPTRTGYTFGGYFTGTNGSGTKYYNADGSSAKNWDKLEGATLYAKWTANTYTVTLDKQSGTGGSGSVTATYNSAMPSATMPTRTGYKFGGYYTGTNGSGTQYYTAAGASTRNWNVASNTTLYAYWKSIYPTSSGTTSTTTDATYWYLYVKQVGNSTITFDSDQTIDVFLVGGGGGGESSGHFAGAGGGGGKTTTATGISVKAGTAYTVTVGAGGAAGTGYGGAGGTGGTTSAFGYSAAGGTGGSSSTGGSGGSGGGAGGCYNSGGNGGYNGGSGGGSDYRSGGSGQGSTTKAFGTGEYYGGGGGGGNADRNGSAGSGGAGGGGNAGWAGTGKPGTDFYGGGGGGAGEPNSDTANGGKGGCGVIIIRGRL